MNVTAIKLTSGVVTDAMVVDPSKPETFAGLGLRILTNEEMAGGVGIGWAVSGEGWRTPKGDAWPPPPEA